jgi:acyl-CoA thioesterase-1
MKMLQLLTWLVLILASHQTFAAAKKILVFGDSLSASYNIPTDKGWVNLLKQELQNKQADSGIADISIANASISGETSAGGLTRFQSQIKKTQPDIVILELGANDGLRGYDLTTTRQNLLAMIKMSQQINASVLLAGIHMPPNYGRTYTRNFDQIFTDLAKMDNVSLIPFILEGVATNPELMQNDGLHPNEEGQKVIVTTVLNHLLPYLADKD